MNFWIHSPENEVATVKPSYVSRSALRNLEIISMFEKGSDGELRYFGFTTLTLMSTENKIVKLIVDWIINKMILVVGTTID